MLFPHFGEGANQVEHVHTSHLVEASAPVSAPLRANASVH